MDAWATFWGWFLIAVLVVFGLLSIAITIGGFFDVKSLFSSIEQQHDEEAP
tara:strand:- start:1099333 stop:1099485 length:153 start_codon:yes stop_codon:yes gene_type:complete